MTKRDRPVVTLTLSPEAIELADALAERWGMTRSALVERLVRAETSRLEPVPVRKEKRR